MQAWLLVVIGVALGVTILIGVLANRAGMNVLADAAALITTLFGIVFIALSIHGLAMLDEDMERFDVEMEYQSLMYRIEHEDYKRDYKKLTKLCRDIESYNDNIAKCKSNQRNAWMGFLIPDIYDDFEFIELP